MLSWICRTSSFRSSQCLHNLPFFPSISVVSLSTSTSKTLIDDYLASHHQFSPKSAAKVSSSLPGKLIFNPQNADSVLNFLKETGFSHIQIETIVRKAPRLVSANVETSLKPKIKVFQDFGFHPSDISEILTVSPWYLGTSSHRLRQSIIALKNVLGHDAYVCKLLEKPSSYSVLAVDPNGRLVPNIEYLKSCGIQSLQIAAYFCRYPMNFFCKLEKLKDYVKRADEMGVPRKSKIFISAVRVIGSMTTNKWEMKLKFLRELGFSEQNIFTAFRITPTFFALSERKIKEAAQLLLCVEDISYIARFPLLLCFSVEKRLKPRLRVLKVLESKNLLSERPAMYAFCHMTDSKFMQKYVIPYASEIRDLYLETLPAATASQLKSLEV